MCAHHILLQVEGTCDMWLKQAGIKPPTLPLSLPPNPQPNKRANSKNRCGGRNRKIKKQCEIGNMWQRETATLVSAEILLQTNNYPNISLVWNWSDGSGAAAFSFSRCRFLLHSLIICHTWVKGWMEERFQTDRTSSTCQHPFRPCQNKFQLYESAEKQRQIHSSFQRHALLTSSKHNIIIFLCNFT